MNFLLNTSTIFFFLDLNDCFALTEISSLKNTQMIGICWFRSSPSYSIENCKTHCLYDSRCVGVNPTGHCIEYMYQAVTSRCHFPRTAIHFIHKGNHIVSYLIKFLFNVFQTTHLLEKMLEDTLFELITYKVEKHAEFNILTVTYRYMQ